MLIPLQEIVQKYNLNIKGVVHAGAHFGQEYEAYKECGIENIMFIEPCEEPFKILFNRFNHYNDVKLAKYAVGSDNVDVVMNIERDNQGQSSSILKPLLHLTQHPNVRFLGDTELVQMVTIDELVCDSDKYDMLMLDLQGYELEALKGATKTFEKINIIYTEINTDYTYSDCALLGEMDDFLGFYGFYRTDTMMASANLTWGDAIYLRESLL